MSDLSHVAAAMGGKPAAVQQFVEAIKTANIPDGDEILPLFKIIELYDDLTLFAFYQHHSQWFSICEETWCYLCQLANQFELSWVFYRAGIECYDTDESDNSEAVYFDERMFELFAIQHPICLKHPKLKMLEQ